MKIHPDTRKFGARFAVSPGVNVTEDIEADIKGGLELRIKDAMEREGMRPINAVRHLVVHDAEFGATEYRAIQLGLPHGVQP